MAVLRHLPSQGLPTLSVILLNLIDYKADLQTSLTSVRPCRQPIAGIAIELTPYSLAY